MTDKITTRLHGLEIIIQRGRASFIEVGKALAAIKAEGLYAEEFGTFEAYCQKRWGFGKAYAYQLIQGSKVVGKLSPEKSSMLDSQRQVQALTSVPEPEREQVLEAASQQAASEGRKMTARDIQTASAPQPSTQHPPPATYPPTDPLSDWQGEPDDVPTQANLPAFDPNTNDDEPVFIDGSIVDRNDVEFKFRRGVRKAVCHRLIYIDEARVSRKEAFRLMAHAAIASCTDESLIGAEADRGRARHQLTGWIEDDDRSSADLIRLVFEVTVMAHRGHAWDTACTLADVNQVIMMEHARQ